MTVFFYSRLNIHPRFQHQRFPGDGMGKFQPFGAQLLPLKAHFCRKRQTFRAAVLGISQNGVPHMGAVEPQLVGAPGDGLQSHAADLPLPFQQAVGGHRGFPLGADFPEQAGQGLSGNGGIDDPLLRQAPPQGQGVVGLSDFLLLQQGMGIGVFCQQNNAEGVPIQPGLGMKGAAFPMLPLVSCHQIGKGSIIFRP